MREIIRVLVVESSSLLVEGLRSVIDKSAESECEFSLEFVGSIHSLERIDEQLALYRPTLVVVNPSLADYSRRMSIKSLFGDARVVALVSSYLSSEVLAQFDATIGLNDEPQRITAAFSSALSSQSEVQSEGSEGSELSEREKEIVVAVARGLMNKEIASLHNISIHTVISHRKNISRKTGIRSASGFVVYALLNGLVDEKDLT